MSNKVPPVDELFRIRAELESLTKNYIEKLTQDKDSVHDHAKLLITILDSIADGLIVVDQDENIVLANKAALRLARCNLQELSRPELSQKFKFLKDDGKTPYPKEQEPYAIAKREKKTAQVEGLVLGDDLEPDGLWLRSTASPVITENGDLFGIVSIFHDITESKRLQQQRDALAALITHDLKNHLAAESMFLDMLASEFADRMNNGDVEMLGRLKFANCRYLEIANTLLELQRTRLHSIESQQEDVDLLEVMNSVLQLNQLMAVKRNIVLTLRAEEGVPKVRTVRSAIHQVFHNLIQNAINVSEPGQTVKANISTARNSVVIRISDEGPGLSQELVDAFTKSQPVPPHKLGSSGVGLFLCRMLIDVYGGKITLNKKKPNEGAAFVIELPYKKG